jgi:hypothetical protein
MIEQRKLRTPLDLRKPDPTEARVAHVRENVTAIKRSDVNILDDLDHRRESLPRKHTGGQDRLGVPSVHARHAAT